MNKIILAFLGGLLLGSATVIAAQSLNDLQMSFYQNAMGCAASPCFTVQGIAGGTALPVSLPTPLSTTVSNTPAVTVSGTPTVSVSGTVSTTQGGFNFLNVTTNTTSAVKTGAGTFHGIAVNGLGTTSTATVYDCNNCTSNKIGTVNTALSLVSMVEDVAFSNGLTVVTAGVAASDITVLYK